MYVHVCISVYSCLSQGQGKREFRQTSAPLIHHHMDHVSLLLSLYQWAHTPTVRDLAQPSIQPPSLNEQLVVHFQCGGIRTAHAKPCGKQLYRLGTASRGSSFAFGLTDSIRFKVTYTNIFSEVSYERFLHLWYRLYHHILYAILESLDLLSFFFFFLVHLHTFKVHSVP